MSSRLDKAIKDFIQIIREAGNKGTSPLDAQAEVLRIDEDGTAWVHLAGGVDETPVKLTINAEVGDKVYIPGQKRPYRVRARDDRYIICTKPYNPQHTVLYFIIDLVDKWRAPDDRLFCMGYETDEDCQERLAELQSGKIDLSVRRGIKLDIDIE